MLKKLKIVWKSTEFIKKCADEKIGSGSTQNKLSLRLRDSDKNPGAGMDPPCSREQKEGEQV